ncbi:hypothetical protein DDI_2113 [Dickeya dianthicola RNS04.9]|nr:hypothetical protein DDI_2113 [Dickeya dianthicola RNS04.9]
MYQNNYSHHQRVTLIPAEQKNKRKQAVLHRAGGFFANYQPVEKTRPI